MIKKILIISFLAIFLVVALTGCSGSGISGILKETSPSLTNQTADTDNIEEESLNGLDDSQEIEAAEADEEVEENEPAGGHQDQDNIDVDHQFEGVE
jgi:hypothetical protein